MRHLPLITLLLLLLFYACGPTESQQEEAQTSTTEEPVTTNPAEQLVQEMIKACGGLDQWKQLQDVEYMYTYQNAATGKKDVSIERYVYDGELSWARYTERNFALMPDKEGEMIQGYNGDTTWVTLDGERLTDPQAIKMADFLRKTNYYWLNMMFKLGDPGVIYEMGEDRTVNGVDYKTVKITFGENVGDARDTYLLYIHPETKMVDQFLFTVMDFGMAQPSMMEVKYEEIERLMWPTYRRYAPAADWEGNLAEDATWSEEISENIKFNNGFDRALFDYQES